LFFKTRFEEIKTKSVLENKINSNIDHRQSPVFLFYFKVPPRGLIRGAEIRFSVKKINGKQDQARDLVRISKIKQV
jgi:hypothetical protein